MSKRCHPGDLARVIYSFYPEMIGRIVLVQWFNEKRSMWAARLLGEPVFGYLDPEPAKSNDWWYRDQSLLPLRGGDPESVLDETVEMEDCRYE